jgi:hypothetical protein
MSAMNSSRFDLWFIASGILQTIRLVCSITAFMASRMIYPAGHMHVQVRSSEEECR